MIKISLLAINNINVKFEQVTIIVICKQQTMKKLILSLMLVVFALPMSAQSDLYVTLWYGQIENADVQDHIEIEREYYSKMWKEQHHDSYQRITGILNRR